MQKKLNYKHKNNTETDNHNQYCFNYPEYLKLSELR
ncbi:hypothetical protein CCDG5_1794 [[Clostridium] cellulosi]|uniref:Uncharacterized protein n=1 Tax=[Clostridium] cellulosi TaxID=29343 RepID=A0A078KQY9_9FIRM|nr:hypothetical protein CCDG5_1794 [[Clostridium] cellulosi]